MTNPYEELADKISENLRLFHSQRPEGPTEIDVVIDTLRAEGWTPKSDHTVVYGEGASVIACACGATFLTRTYGRTVPLTAVEQWNTHRAPKPKPDGLREARDNYRAAWLEAQANPLSCGGKSRRWPRSGRRTTTAGQECRTVSESRSSACTPTASAPPSPHPRPSTTTAPAGSWTTSVMAPAETAGCGS